MGTLFFSVGARVAASGSKVLVKVTEKNQKSDMEIEEVGRVSKNVPLAGKRDAPWQKKENCWLEESHALHLTDLIHM